MSKTSIPPKIRQIVNLLTRLELAFAQKPETETKSSLINAAQIEGDKQHGDYKILHAVLTRNNDTTGMLATADFLKSESRLRNITGIYESSTERRQTGTTMESVGIHIVDAPVYSDFAFVTFYVRKEDLPSLTQSVEAKIATLREAERVAKQEAENEGISAAFLKAVSPDAICNVMHFKKKNDRGPKDLIAEAETVLKIAHAAPDIAEADDKGDPLTGFLQKAYADAKNGKAATGLDSAAMLKTAANNFAEARKLRPTMEEMGWGLAA